jgi:hypothetical protein
MKHFLLMTARWAFLCWLPIIPCAPFTAGMVWAGFHPYAVFGVTSFFWCLWFWVAGKTIASHME